VLVLDTNIWVSFALNRNSELGRSVAQLIAKQPYAFSEDTFRELTEVILRNKFDPYVSRRSRIEILRLIASGAEWFKPANEVSECRDPEDNKFLELAITANATHILTGDDDILCLDPFRGIRITTLSFFVRPE